MCLFCLLICVCAYKWTGTDSLGNPITNPIYLRFIKLIKHYGFGFAAWIHWACWIEIYRKPWIYLLKMGWFLFNFPINQIWDFGLQVFTGKKNYKPSKNPSKSKMTHSHGSFQLPILPIPTRRRLAPWTRQTRRAADGRRCAAWPRPPAHPADRKHLWRRWCLGLKVLIKVGIKTILIVMMINNSNTKNDK